MRSGVSPDARAGAAPDAGAELSEPSAPAAPAAPGEGACVCGAADPRAPAPFELVTDPPPAVSAPGTGGTVSCSDPLCPLSEESVGTAEPRLAAEAESAPATDPIQPHPAS